MENNLINVIDNFSPPKEKTTKYVSVDNLDNVIDHVLCLTSKSGNIYAYAAASLIRDELEKYVEEIEVKGRE